MASPPREEWDWEQQLGALFFAALLGWEWLWPLPQVTDTRGIGWFALTFLLFLTLDTFRVSAKISVPAKVVIILFFLSGFYFSPWPQPGEWRAILLGEVFPAYAEDPSLRAYFAGPPARTAAFFLLLWAVATFLVRRMVWRRRAMLPFVLTIVYLSTLDSFTRFDGGGAVARTIVYGFFCLAWFRWNRLQNQSTPSTVKGWFAATWALIALAVGIGWLAPKADASWPDPVSWITSLDERAGSQTQGRFSGYSTDDSRLGGPFIQDRRAAFRATVDHPYYWRGETLHIYNGYGWEKNTPNQLAKHIHLYPDPTIRVPESMLLFHHLEAEENRATVVWNQPRYHVLFTPGQLRRADPGQPLIGDWHHHGFFFPYDPPGRYSVTAEIPQIDEEKLRQSSMEYPKHVTRKYLQLPDTLPDRVKKKAREITAGADNPYDKARAVEQFLKTDGGFRYEIQDVPIPKENEDFVDQFLFDTKQGYCNHFSSAMVVLLRTADIPARWVKGFAPGETELENGQYHVTVRNADAHSWVEVYFNDFGWLPFEPTPGFSNPTPLEREETRADSGEDTSSASPPSSNHHRNPEVRDPSAPTSSGEKDMQSSDAKNRWVWWTAALLLVVGWTFWAFRSRLVWWWFHRYPCIEGGNRFTLIRAFRQFLRLLAWRKGPRKPHQTAREYISGDDWLFSTPSPEMREITRLFEQARYGITEQEKSLWERTRRLWSALLKQTRP